MTASEQTFVKENVTDMISNVFEDSKTGRLGMCFAKFKRSHNQQFTLAIFHSLVQTSRRIRQLITVGLVSPSKQPWQDHLMTNNINYEIRN